MWTIFSYKSIFGEKLATATVDFMNQINHKILLNSSNKTQGSQEWLMKI